MAEGLNVVLPDGRIVAAEVRRSARATVPRIRVGASAPLHIVVPAAMGLDEIGGALNEKASWIASKLDGIQELRASADQLDLDRPNLVWLHGKPIPVRLVWNIRAAGVVENVLCVPLTGAETEAAAIERWYRRRARADFGKLVAEEAGRLGINCRSLAVRDQRTRWGSCSSAGNLSLSWRLVMMPPEIARYVVIHELLHVRTPNHSRAFWRSLAAAMPGWDEHAAWLRRNGEQFRRWSPLELELTWAR
jgi:predicted metal-dependent hydrolase